MKFLLIKIEFEEFCQGLIISRYANYRNEQKKQNVENCTLLTNLVF